MSRELCKVVCADPSLWFTIGWGKAHCVAYTDRQEKQPIAHTLQGGDGQAMS